MRVRVLLEATVNSRHASLLVLSPRPPRWLFEVANRRGDWLPAVGGVDMSSGTARVTPKTTVTCESPDACWLAAVRYAVMDVPQCALYNAAEIPASQFELPVPWAGRDNGQPV